MPNKHTDHVTTATIGHILIQCKFACMLQTEWLSVHLCVLGTPVSPAKTDELIRCRLHWADMGSMNCILDGVEDPPAGRGTLGVHATQSGETAFSRPFCSPSIHGSLDSHERV